MNDELKELKEIMSVLADEELLRIVNIDYADYRQDAHLCAKQELMARGVSPDNPRAEKEMNESEITPDVETVTAMFLEALDDDDDYPKSNHRRLWAWQGWPRLFVLLSLALALGATVSFAQIWLFKLRAVATVGAVVGYRQVTLLHFRKWPLGIRVITGARRIPQIQFQTPDKQAYVFDSFTHMDARPRQDIPCHHPTPREGQAAGITVVEYEHQPSAPREGQGTVREPVPGNSSRTDSAGRPADLSRVAELARRMKVKSVCHYVEVLYDPRNPDHAMINSPAMWMDTIVWLGAAAFSGLFWIWSRKRQRGSKIANICLIGLLLLIGSPRQALAQAADPQLTVSWEPERLSPRSPCLVRITSRSPLNSLTGKWLDGRTVFFTPTPDRKTWYGVAVVGASARSYTLELEGATKKGLLGGSKPISQSQTVVVSAEPPNGGTEKGEKSNCLTAAKSPGQPTLAPSLVKESPPQLSADPPALDADNDDADNSERDYADINDQERIVRESWLKAKAFDVISPSPLWSGGFSCPMDEMTITSPFGELRDVGVSVRTHQGTDYRARVPTPVKAMNSGQVVLARNMLLEGNYVVLNHGQGLFSFYLHLSEFRVKEGDWVRRNQEIGLSGNTGRSQAPHLHVGVKWQKLNFDPERIFALKLPGVKLARPSPRPPPPPSRLIETSAPETIFKADKNTLAYGDCARLSWSARAATGVIVMLNGMAEKPSAERRICPGANTTYHLEVIGNDGIVDNHQLKIKVLPPPIPPPRPTEPLGANFKTDTTTLTQGECAGLSWQARNAASATLDGMAAPMSARRRICPGIDTIYRLEIKGRDGSIDSRQIKISVLPRPVVLYSFADSAPAASWRNQSEGKLEFGGSVGDGRGFAANQSRAGLEDDTARAKVIEVHPIGGGGIQGVYKVPIVFRAGDKFRAQIGFLKDAKAGNARLQLYFRKEIKSRNLGRMIGEIDKVYNRMLQPWEIDLSPLAGQSGMLILQVINRSPSSVKAGVCWINPRIER